MDKLFTACDAWTGGFYELAVELGPRDDTKLVDALRAVWGHPSIDGCYLERDREPSTQPRVSIDHAWLARARADVADEMGPDGPGTAAPRLLGGDHVFGVAHVPGGRVAPCGTCIVREDDGPDWLDFYLPMGGLERVYPCNGFPFDDGRDQAWRTPLDDWLVTLGEALYARVPFDLALIGHEASGERYAADLERDGIPDRRWDGILMPRGGCLTYFPRTAP